MLNVEVIAGYRGPDFVRRIRSGRFLDSAPVCGFEGSRTSQVTSSTPVDVDISPKDLTRAISAGDAFAGRSRNLGPNA
jgi:hypothetical protein